MSEFKLKKRAFGSLTHDTTYGLTLVLNTEHSEFYNEDSSEVLITRYYCLSRQPFALSYHSSSLTSSSADMRSLFDPVVENVITLLKQ